MGAYNAGRKTPCKDCKDRTIEPNCHMTCERYLDMVENNKKKRQEREKILVLSGAKMKTQKFQP